MKNFAIWEILNHQLVSMPYYNELDNLFDRSNFCKCDIDTIIDYIGKLMDFVPAVSKYLYDLDSTQIVQTVQ